jgi:hypothetical protein
VSKIYVSHKATEDDDRRMAKALAAELEAMGHRAIYNAAELHPGRNWRDAHILELADSDAVVALLTKNQSNSVMGEIGVARAFHYAFLRCTSIDPYRLRSTHAMALGCSTETGGWAAPWYFSRPGAWTPIGGSTKWPIWSVKACARNGQVARGPDGNHRVGRQCCCRLPRQEERRRYQTGRLYCLDRHQGHRRQATCDRGSHFSRVTARRRGGAIPAESQARFSDDQCHGLQDKLKIILETEVCLLSLLR